MYGILLQVCFKGENIYTCLKLSYRRVSRLKFLRNLKLSYRSVSSVQMSMQYGIIKQVCFKGENIFTV